VQIFKWFNGANDVEILAPVADRINMTFDWTFEGLGLFGNGKDHKVGKGPKNPVFAFVLGYLLEEMQDSPEV
jgi:hypothetical protein